MARLALGVVGAAAGTFLLPGVGTALGLSLGAGTGASLGFALGSAVGDYLFAPKLKSQGPRLNDLSVQGSAYGSPIPQVWGAVRLAGQMVWSGGIVEHESTTSSGGKGGGGGGSYTTYSYTCSFAVVLCEGPIAGVRRIWADSVLLYDRNPAAGATDEEVLNSFLASGELFERITVYPGTMAQVPDPLIASDAHYATTGAPAYRGRALMVFENLELEKFGNRIPSISVELYTDGTGGDVIALRELALRQTAGVNYYANSDTVYSFDTARVEGNMASVVRYRHRYGGNLVKDDGERFDWPGLNAVPAHDAVTAIVGTSDTPRFVIVENASDLWLVDLAPEIEFRYHLGLGFTPTALAAASRWALRNNTLMVRYSAGTNSQIWVFTLKKPKGGIDRQLRRLTLTDAPGGITLSADGRTGYYSTQVGGQVQLWSFDPRTTDAPGLIFTSPASYTHINPAYLDSTNEGIWMAGDDRVYQIGTDGTLRNTYTSPYGARHAISNFIVTNNVVVLQFANDEVWSVPTPPAVDSVPVGRIVTDLATRCGASADVTALDGKTVAGYFRSRPMPGRAAVEPLQQAHLFDVVEHDDTLRAVVRGTGATVTVEGDVIVSGREYTTQRTQASELPRRVVTQYLARGADYQAGTQQAQRIESDAVAESVVDLPIVMTDDEAAQVAEVLLYQAWQSRETITSVSLPPSFSRLEPADVLTLRDAGEERRVRITRVGFTAPGLVELAGTVEDASVYTSQARGGLVAVDSIAVRFAGTTDIVLLDTHLLDSNGAPAGIYAGASGGAGWQGAIVYTSPNNVDWSPAGTVSATMTWGVATTELAPGPVSVTDHGNRVTVTLYDGTLASTDTMGFLAGVNVALLGDEIIAFRDATLTAVDTYELSVLSRGRRGTEQHMTHDVDDRFVLLNRALIDLTLTPDQRGSDLYVKAVSHGQRLEDAETLTVPFDNHRAKPYAPAHLEVTDVAAGEYTLGWVRRARDGGEWVDGADVALVDSPEAYRVTVSRADVQVSSATVSSTSATVTAQSGDVVRVAQVSPTYGAGYETELTL